jgi:DNA-binding transcriptional MerR regulator
MGNSTMLSIKEFADFTGLSEPTLRYYDKIGLLSPEFRGENRYRYYGPMQTITVEFIKVLIRVGIPLSKIKEINRNKTPQGVAALLSQQENKLDEHLYELQKAYSILHTYRNNIQAGMAADLHGMSVQELSEERIILGQTADYGGADTFYRPYMEFRNMAYTNKIDLHYPTGGLFEDIDDFLRAPSRPTSFFSLDPRGKSKRKAGQYLVAYNQGYYAEFGNLPQRMVDYARAHGLSFCGSVYVTYLLNAISVTDHSQFVSRIVAGVSKIPQKA